jgi:hypothetical protein
MKKFLRWIALVSASSILVGCVKNEAVRNEPIANWDGNNSKLCCIWTAKGLLSKAGSRVYEYKVEENGMAYIKTEGTAIFDRNNIYPKDEIREEFNKVCKQEYKTEVLRVVTKPTTQINVIKYPQVIVGRCISKVDFAQIEQSRKNIDAEAIQSKQRMDERLKEIREQKKVEEIAARKVRCTNFGFESGSDAHAKCVMELSIAADSGFNNQSSESTSSREKSLVLAREQAIQEAKIKEQKRIADMEANIRLIELGTILMTGNTANPVVKKSRTHTYFINGHSVTCNTIGKITTCY